MLGKAHNFQIHTRVAEKEMNNTVMVIALLMVLVGCTTMYTHPNYSEQKWAADYAFCSAQGGQASGGANDPNSTRRDRTIRNCLIGKGWSKQ
jgi:hypothetical protein